jgi:hypothetical protein
MSLPPDKQQGIDRLVAIGTTGMGRDLGYLRVNRRFSDILSIVRGEVRDVVKDIGDDSDTRNSPPVERWTAAAVVIRTRAR